jgi:suppressor of ftsI
VVREASRRARAMRPAARILFPLLWVACGIVALADCAPTGQRSTTLAVPEVRSSAGVAIVRLDAVLAADGTPAFSYAGRVGVAPTIRVVPGDRIIVVLHNDMRAQRNHRNDVNLHFHGLSVSPQAPGDDVLTMLAHPGETLRYDVRVPADHPPGLYWYHPHVHGQAFWQVAHGMSGAIVVEGLQRRIPALEHMRERIVILRQRPTGSDITEANDAPDSPEAVEDAAGNPCRPEVAMRPTIDGQPRERFEIGRGEEQFFRVLNASASRYFDLSIDGVAVHLVAVDGVPLDAYPGTRAILTLNHVEIAPGGRAEFVVQGPAASAVLRSRCVDSGPSGDAQPAAILGELAVEPGAATGPALALAEAADLPDKAPSKDLPPPARRRLIRLTEDAKQFYINGKTFDMRAMGGAPAVAARAGTVEEWDISNDTDEGHDFHIHQVHFVQEAVNGIPVADRHWADTVDVPSRMHHWNHTTPGTVRLLVDFRDPIVRGRFVFHCHILDHEDRGMMATLEVR